MSIEERIEQKLDNVIESHQELRLAVKGISTKMDILVGPDGTDGTVRNFADRLQAIETRASRAAGAYAMIGLAIGGLFHWAWDKIFILGAKLFGVGH